MTRLISIHEASQQTGLSVSTIRRGVASGRFPATRANSAMGKIMFDPNILAQTLRNEVLSNLSNSGGWNEESSNTYDKSFAPENEKTSMANVNKLFGKIDKNDVKAGLFAPDKFHGKSDDSVVTSETISINNSSNK